MDLPRFTWEQFLSAMGVSDSDVTSVSTERWHPTSHDRRWPGLPAPLPGTWRERLDEVVSKGYVEIDGSTSSVLVGTSDDVIEIYRDVNVWRCRLVCRRTADTSLVGQLREKLALQDADLVVPDAVEGPPTFADGITPDDVAGILLAIAVTSPDVPDGATHVGIAADACGAPGPVGYMQEEQLILPLVLRDAALFRILRGWAKPQGMVIQNDPRRSCSDQNWVRGKGRSLRVGVPFAPSATLRVASGAQVHEARESLRAWLSSMGCSTNLAGTGP